MFRFKFKYVFSLFVFIIFVPMTLNKDHEIGPQCICDQNGLNLFSNPTLRFVLSIVTKCNKSRTMKSKAFFDYGASTWFIEKELMR